jgi:pimeloyl-ACP methyl ester carboxylesterase
MEGAAAALLILLSVPAVAQSSAAAPTFAWWSDYATHSRQVPIGGGRTLNLLCEGFGSPTVILESGTGDGMTVWRKVQPVLAEHYRVCAYDRAGLGLSAPGPEPRDLDAEVADLEKLAIGAQLDRPYLLVSHSFGGLIVRAYARRHPGQVAGMVLVDPPIEGQTERVAKLVDLKSMAMKQIEHSRQCASATAPRGDCSPSIPDDAPPTMAARLRSAARAHFLAEAGEMEAATTGRDDAEFVRGGSDLGDLPLVVLTSEQFKTNEHMPPELRTAAQKLWMSFHDEIAAHSKRGSNRVIAGTGHYIHLERPDAVVAAVEEVASAARKH